jgi:hypothetical protein
MNRQSVARVVLQRGANPTAFINGYDQLVEFGALFYPVRPDKTPAVRGKLDRIATLDPSKIHYLAVHCHHRRFAARFPRDCPLMVVDTESPFKYPDRSGPDGEMFLCSLLDDTGLTLPPCPTVQTPSGGFHRYFRAPKWFPIRPKVALWPGVDILAQGSTVILPSWRTETGEYRPLRSFEECEIPEAPRAFVKLIRAAQSGLARRGRVRAKIFLETADTTIVSRRQWYLLFRNRVFGTFWGRQGKFGDTTDSAYEYHLAKACFCCGLNQCQAESVILAWRRKHGLNRDLRQLRVGIIPSAWSEVEPWVRDWLADRDAASRSKQEAKTSNRILRFIQSSDGPQTPSSTAAALGIPRERAKKALQRIAKEGRLLRTSIGYISASGVGTF